VFSQVFLSVRFILVNNTMGDWDDDEFEVPVFVAPVVKGGWEDEDEVVEEVVVKTTAAQVEAAAKKVRDDEIAFAAKVAKLNMEKETPEQKKLRERLAGEEADNQLAGELFQTAGSAPKTVKSADLGASLSKGLGSIALKTKQDHMSFGTTVSQKLSTSSAFNVAGFYKTLAKTLEAPTMTSEVLDEILAEINKIRDNKLKTEKPAVNKAANAKKSKAALAAVAKAHSDKYGGSDDVDKYDHYNDMEDDFM
jgi:hypothetical protein